MTACILSIGTELTRGELLNGNGTWLATRLTMLGHEVTEIVCLDDDLEHLISELHRLGAQHSVLVATGGLGPTTDDLTRPAGAAVLGAPLVREPRSLAAIERRLRERGRAMSESNARQADLPAGAQVLGNGAGTAPGFAATIGSAQSFFLPGVPAEMRLMFEEQVVPRLPASREQPGHQIVLHTFGMGESGVGDALDGIERECAVTVGYRVHLPDVEVKVLARRATLEEARIAAQAAASSVRARLGDDLVYGEGEATYPQVVADLLRGRRESLALAESCTGGLVAELVTAVPGVSDVFQGGLVTYSNRSKVDLLGVPEALLAEHGAVSEPVARAMAEGARARLGATYGLALTGVAGPSGGTPSAPVGFVHYAVAGPEGQLAASQRFGGDRAAVRRRAAQAALALLRSALRRRATPGQGL